MGHRPGAIVRSARRSKGLTLAQLGQKVGYSAAQVSRYERGIAPLTDVAGACLIICVRRCS